MENKTLNEKLLNIQAEIAPIKKTETNPFYNSKYFDINAILEQLKPILTKHKVILTQPFAVLDSGRTILITRLTDSETAEKIDSYIVIPEVADPQKLGSAITYIRRYALQSLLALEAEDDDANVASNRVASANLDKPLKTNPYIKGAKPKTDALLNRKADAELSAGDVEINLD